MSSVIKLRSSKLRNISLLLISLVFVLVGVLLMEKSSIISYFVTGFFGLCACVFLIQLFPNSSYLKLKPEGFEFRSLFRSSFVSWSEVSQFVVIIISGNRMVGWNYLKGKKSSAKKASKFISGTEAALP